MEKPGHRIEAASLTFPTGLKSAVEVSEQLKGAITVERLLELTEAGYMPHWRIDGGDPLFKAAEVKSWVAANLLRYDGGREFPARLQVVLAHDMIDDPPPEAIRQIVGLRQMKAEMEPGVYFLCKGGGVVYVGQSVAPMQRIHTHRAEGFKDYDFVFILPCPRGDLYELEQAFIRWLKPKYNSPPGAGKRIPDMSREQKALLQTLFSKAGEKGDG